MVDPQVAQLKAQIAEYTANIEQWSTYSTSLSTEKDAALASLATAQTTIADLTTQLDAARAKDAARVEEDAAWQKALEEAQAATVQWSAYSENLQAAHAALEGEVGSLKLSKESSEAELASLRPTPHSSGGAVKHTVWQGPRRSGGLPEDGERDPPRRGRHISRAAERTCNSDSRRRG